MVYLVGLVASCSSALAADLMGGPLSGNVGDLRPEDYGQGFLPLPLSLGCAASYSNPIKVTSTWYDTSTAYALDLWDNGVATDFFARMPFPFDYYGERSQNIAISDNGWVSLFDQYNGALWDNDETPDCTPNWPDTSAPSGTIAPFWCDLDPFSATQSLQKRVELATFGVAPRRAFVVTWRDFPRASAPTTSSYTFQVVFYETTNIIRFQYLDMIGGGADSAIGIEDRNGTQAVGVSCGSSPDESGKALEFRPVLPALNCASATPIACGATLSNQPMTGNDAKRQYGCTNGTYFASERIYSLQLTTVSHIDINLSPTLPNQILRAFLTQSCDACSCTEFSGADNSQPTRIQTVLGPGTYYLIVDGPSAGDNGPFNLSLACETLLGAPTGRTMTVGAAGVCPTPLDFDRYSDGAGVWTREGWLRYSSDRNFWSLRVDSTKVASTNPRRSECTAFSKMVSWVDDNTDKAIVYWQSLPEADIIQSVSGMVSGSGASTCCGARVETRLLNRDVFRHLYELRAQYSPDFGRGSDTGLCANPGPPPSGQSHVVGGPLKVNATAYTDERDLTCRGGGLCAMDCNKPVELESADDLATKLIVQLYGDNTFNKADTVQGEWIYYYDADQICDPAPDPWTGAYLPIADVIGFCKDTGGSSIPTGLVYSWRYPPGTNTDCTNTGDPCLAKGQEQRYTHFFGNGCRVSACAACLPAATLVAPEPRICLGHTETLDASASSVGGCTGATTYSWTRDGAPMNACNTGNGSPTCTPANEGVAGDHVYTMTVGCIPPPAPSGCTDTKTATISAYDCAACSATADIQASGTSLCTGQSARLDGTGSSTTNCPGTVTYAWYRAVDANPPVLLPEERDPTLYVAETAAGNYTYTLRVSCEAPPVGLGCVASPDASVTLDYGNSAGTPADIANTLRAKKSASGADLSLSWAASVDGITDSYGILRGVANTDLAAPGPPPGPPLLQTTTTPDLNDAGAVSGASPNAPYYVYRVRGAGCGTIGPY